MTNLLEGRVHVDTQGGNTHFSVPAKKDWKLLFFAVWLAGWVTMPLHIVLKAIKSLNHPESADWFNVFWSFGWSFGVIFVGWSIVWGIGGKEVLRLNSSEVLLTKDLFGLVVRRKLSLTNEVRNLRDVPAYSQGRKQTESSIRYEDGKGTVKFGSGLEDSEALAIIERMIAVHPFPKRDKALEYMDINS